ncbi:hypothetical protein [Arsenicibacter rosenii]|uniref:Uncharacterized protein n=1 Tax=Arsenicibacter rosenii TaxID=1750698 RepID=A0A1S2VEK6_9BACT|nr:hypothetical protein [Arsenicibacter rosenii]OIN57153.1 hypothetical protein BLX24_21630 [Arsenicibacter rosenii]
MEKGEYDLREEAYQTALAEMHQTIDTEFAEREKQYRQKVERNQTQTRMNLRLKQRVHGGNGKETLHPEEALKKKEKQRQAFLERQLAQKKQRAAELAERQVFGQTWGRLAEREVVYGASDALVTQLKQQREAQQQQKRAQMEYERPTFGMPHALDIAKGQSVERFNSLEH